MVFHVEVAADIYATKCNVRLEFPAFPTMACLITATEAEFDTTSRMSCPAGFPCVPFRVQSFQVYDEVFLRWVDLYSTSQLTSECQVYANQPESALSVSDVRAEIPEPCETVVVTNTLGLPSRVLERARVQEAFEASLARCRAEAAAAASLARARARVREEAAAAEQMHARAQLEYESANLEASLADARAEEAGRRKSAALHSLSHSTSVRRTRSVGASRRYL